MACGLTASIICASLASIPCTTCRHRHYCLRTLHTSDNSVRTINNTLLRGTTPTTRELLQFQYRTAYIARSIHIRCTYSWRRCQWYVRVADTILSYVCIIFAIFARRSGPMQIIAGTICSMCVQYRHQPVSNTAVMTYYYRPIIRFSSQERTNQ